MQHNFAVFPLLLWSDIPLSDKHAGHIGSGIDTQEKISGGTITETKGSWTKCGKACETGMSGWVSGNRRRRIANGSGDGHVHGLPSLFDVNGITWNLPRHVWQWYARVAFLERERDVGCIVSSLKWCVFEYQITSPSLCVSVVVSLSVSLGCGRSSKEGSN